MVPGSSVFGNSNTEADYKEIGHDNIVENGV